MFSILSSSFKGPIFDFSFLSLVFSSRSLFQYIFVSFIVGTMASFRCSYRLEGTDEDICRSTSFFNTTLVWNFLVLFSKKLVQYWPLKFFQQVVWSCPLWYHKNIPRDMTLLHSWKEHISCDINWFQFSPFVANYDWKNDNDVDLRKMKIDIGKQ